MFLELEKETEKIKKKFAEKKKFPTFAVPNETGANERSSGANKKKIETTEVETEGGTLRPAETQTGVGEI